MKWTNIDSRLNEEIAFSKHYKELTSRLKLIDKEIIRLIDAKRRYEQELQELLYSQNKRNDAPD